MARKTKAPVKEHEETINILSYLTDKHKEDIRILQTQDQRNNLIRDRKNELHGLLMNKIMPIAQKFKEIFSDISVECGYDDEIEQMVLAVEVSRFPRKLGFFFEIDSLGEKQNKLDTTQHTLLDTNLISYSIGNFNNTKDRIKYSNFSESCIKDVIPKIIDILKQKGAIFRKDINLSCNAEKFIEEI